MISVGDVVYVLHNKTKVVTHKKYKIVSINLPLEKYTLRPIYYTKAEPGQPIDLLEYLDIEHLEPVNIIVDLKHYKLIPVTEASDILYGK